MTRPAIDTLRFAADAAAAAMYFAERGQINDDGLGAMLEALAAYSAGAETYRQWLALDVMVDDHRTAVHSTVHSL